MPRGRRLVVVTNGGGLGIVSTDAARDAGLEVPLLDDAVRGRLTAGLPVTASVINPVDLVGDADAARYGHALRALGSGSADAALVVLTAQAATDSLGVARAVIDATRGWPITVLATFVGGARVAPGARALEEAGIPCYSFPESAVETLARMALLQERRRRELSDPAVGLPAGVTFLKWENPVTENPGQWDTEVWELYNFTADAHPIHVHEVFFEIVNRQGLDKKTGLPIQASRPPEPTENGFKDTVIAYPGEVTRIRLKFSELGQYVWHCHIVEHEDNEMMRPYRIGPPQPGEPA